MVIYDAAATIVSLKCITSKELRSVINILQTFLSSPKSASRYAAIRPLNKVSIDHWWRSLVLLNILVLLPRTIWIK